MRRPSRRISRLLGFTVVPVSLVATGLFVTASSYSVFSAQTPNSGNSWTAGSISLTDDDANAAMFTVSNIKPGQTGERCIVVTYNGSNTVGSTVKLYGSGYAGSTPSDIGTRINLVVDQGSGSSFAGSSAGTTGSCSGFTPLGTGSAVYTGALSAFATANTGYSTVNTTNPWTPTGTGANETRVYRFKWTFQDGGAPASPTTGDNVYQGKAASINFVWEAQTT